MAKKPTQNEIAARKKALLDFMQQHAMATMDICTLINEGSIRQTSLRTVQCWLADSASPSSRTPPEDIVDKLAERLAERESGGARKRA